MRNWPVVLAVVLSAIFTVIVGWIVLIEAENLWEFVKYYASRIDWKPPFLILFVLGYFIAGLEIWVGEIERISRLPRNERVRAIPLALLRGSSLPAIAAVLMPFALVAFLIESFLRNVLHSDAAALVQRSIAIFAMIWFSVFTILIYANLWQPKELACSWKFPKITTCLLVKHQNLAGGLIAAGGTIFGGWLAWTAMQSQRKNRDGA